jgi:hypothetical protein
MKSGYRISFGNLGSAGGCLKVGTPVLWTTMKCTEVESSKFAVLDGVHSALH